MMTSANIFYHLQPIFYSLNILKIILLPFNFCSQVCHLSTAIENCLLIRVVLPQNISIHACCSFFLDSDFKLMQYLTWHTHNHGFGLSLLLNIHDLSYLESRKPWSRWTISSAITLTLGRCWATWFVLLKFSCLLLCLVIIYDHGGLI